MARVPFLLLLAFLGSKGCSGPINPSSSDPSPSPTYPRGKANATIFENIALIRQLEGNFARNSSLVFMGGGATQDGRVSADFSWRYQFGYTTDRFHVVQWVVLPDGTIRYDGEIGGLNVTSTNEIGPALVHDSPEIARLARSYGAQPFVDRFPGALVSCTYRYRFGTPEGYAQFFADRRHDTVQGGHLPELRDRWAAGA